MLIVKGNVKLKLHFLLDKIKVGLVTSKTIVSLSVAVLIMTIADIERELLFFYEFIFYLFLIEG